MAINEMKLRKGLFCDNMLINVIKCVIYSGRTNMLLSDERLLHILSDCEISKVELCKQV